MAAHVAAMIESSTTRDARRLSGRREVPQLQPTRASVMKPTASSYSSAAIRRPVAHIDALSAYSSIATLTMFAAALRRMLLLCAERPEREGNAGR